ncbi:MAG: VCBS repeat-containing protein, partial [Verrucomicrobiota bacterium]
MIIKSMLIAGRSFLGALAWAALVTAAQAQTPETNRFGFSGKEIYPINESISLLHAADMDGDGLTDLIVVNNARSKINILYNQTGKTNVPPAEEGIKKEINQLPPDARFRITSIASEKRISSLVVADLNGDGLPDLAYYGDPKELVVLYNQGTNGWSAPKRWPIADGQMSVDALTSGDLHGSGRRGLILLGENNIYYLAQNADHTLAEPEKIPFAGTVKGVQALEIDGEGRDDLLLVNWDDPDPFRFRLQNAQGQLGPEVHFNFPPVRSWLADDLDGDHKMELVTIAQNSGRAQISTFTRKPAEPLSGAFKSGQF